MCVYMCGYSCGKQNQNEETDVCHLKIMIGETYEQKLSLFKSDISISSSHETY